MRTKLFLITICAVLLSAASCAKPERTFPEGTAINGTDISGMTEKKAKAVLAASCDRALSGISYTIQFKDGTETLSAADIAVKCDVDKALSTALTSGGDVTVEYSCDKSVAKAHVDTLCIKHTSAPTEAKAEYDGKGSMVFTEGSAGQSPDSDMLCQELTDAVKSGKSATFTAEYKDLPPSEKSYDEVMSLNAPIAEFTTSFSRSPLNAENRVNNIVKAAEKVNGTVLAPGETFDTNSVLGDRNEENGWYTAPGIVNGKYKQEYGGGVCQVSTTLYNAALYANLRIDERTPHSIPVSYVDLGRDATISTGGPNLRFTNTTGSQLTIAATVDRDAESITVRFFGRKPSEYEKVEIYSEQTGIIYAPEAEYVRDTSLRAGEYVTDRAARNGKRAATYRIFYNSDGEKIKTETVSRDTYAAFSAIVLYND